MSVVHVHTMQEFEEAIASSTLTICDAFATWCGPCVMMTPVLEELAANNAGSVNFIKIDVDVEQDIAARLNVNAMPTFKFFKNGQQVDELVGADPEELMMRMAENM